MDKTHIFPRKLARSMARKELEKSKATGFNKERLSPAGGRLPSLFARNWRELAQKATARKYPKKKGRA